VGIYIEKRARCLVGITKKQGNWWFCSRKISEPCWRFRSRKIREPSSRFSNHFIEVKGSSCCILEMVRARALKFLRYVTMPEGIYSSRGVSWGKNWGSNLGLQFGKNLFVFSLNISGTVGATAPKFCMQIDNSKAELSFQVTFMKFCIVYERLRVKV